MHFPFLHPATKELTAPVPKHDQVVLQEHAHNTYEGSEFLDDAIRTHEQPLIYTEESIAAGSPQNLL